MSNRYRWSEEMLADHLAKTNPKKEAKPSKYKNVKTTVDGIVFDSKKEAHRYAELKLLLRSGAIKELELQPKFTFPLTYRSGRHITYAADFRYNQDGKSVVEDVKGVQTREFKLKEAMLRYFFNITVVLT